MKVIFLDIDGVLNTERKALQAYEGKCESHDEFGRMFDEESLCWLNKIIDETGAEIVISSSWRNDGLGTLRKMWRKRYCKYILSNMKFDKISLKGLEILNPYRHYDKIVDVTFSLTTSNFNEQKTLLRQLSEENAWKRGNQIDIYLKTHPEITKYVIIDDDNDMLDCQQKYFINTKDPNGIEEEHYKNAVRILNSNL